MSFKELLLKLMGEDRFVTTEQIYQSSLEEELVVVEAPEGGWPGREGKWVRLANRSLSVFYLRTDREDGKKVESLDIHIFTHRGGAWVTFIDDTIIEFTHNMVRKHVPAMHPRNVQRLWQILLKVRQALPV